MLIAETHCFSEEEDEIVVKKVSAVQKEDVKDIGRILRYKLMQSNITSE
jgi:hypothetical protein